MRANRRRDTQLELSVRSALHRLGFRFRVDYPIPIKGRRPVRVDIAFTKVKVVVELDGCFWHGCPQCTQGTPGKNRAYWSAKIGRNKERDLEHTSALEAAGWTVMRFWGHESPGAIVSAVAAEIDRARNRLDVRQPT